MSQRQLQRFQVMSLVEAGKMGLKEAAERIGMSYRQTKRIRKRVKEEGIKGLVHGNTGKRSSHQMKEEVKGKVLKLSQKVYGEFNDQHFTEKLVEEEGIEISRETVRKIRRAAGIEARQGGRSSDVSVNKLGYFLSFLHHSEARAFRKEGGLVEKDRAAEGFGGG